MEGRQLLSDWPVSPKIQIFPKIRKEQLLQVCVVWIWFSFLSLKSLLHIQLQWLKIGRIYLYEFSVKCCLSGAGRPHKNSQWPDSRLSFPQQQQRFVLEFCNFHPWTRSCVVLYLAPTAHIGIKSTNFQNKTDHRHSQSHNYAHGANLCNGEKEPN